MNIYYKLTIHKMETHTFNKLKQLLTMNLVTKIEKAQICDKCNQKFDNNRELKMHISSVHEGKKMYRCSLCKAFFQT